MEKKNKQIVPSLRNVLEYVHVIELAMIVHRTEESLATTAANAPKGAEREAQRLAMIVHRTEESLPTTAANAPKGGELSVESEYYTKITSKQAFELFEGAEEDLNLTFVGGEIRPHHNEWTADVDWAEGGWLTITFNLLKNESWTVV